MGELPQCGICDGDQQRRQAIDRALAQGKYPTLIEREMRGLDYRVKSETVTKHRDHYLARLKTTQHELMAQLTGQYAQQPDLAVLVRDDVRRRVEDGELHPSVQQGLMAQSMLDRREERAQDRELALGLARLLSGGGEAAPARVIDGSHTRLPERVGDRRPDRVAVPSRPSDYRTTDTAT